LENEATEIISDAISFAENSPTPAPADAFQDIFAV